MAPAAGRRTYLRSGSLALLLGGVALALAPHAVRLPPWLTPVLALLVAWRAALEAGRRPLPPKPVLAALALAGLAALLATSRDLPIRDASLALLAFVTGLKLLEMGTDRDRRLVAFLGYFLVYTNFLYSQTLPSAACAVALTLVLTAAVVSLSDAAGHRSAVANLATGASLLAQSAPLALLLFVLFPRLSPPLWGLAREATGISGLSDSMEPGSIGRLVLSEEVAFRVEFSGSAQTGALHYWRGPVFERTDGRRWWSAGSPGAAPPASPEQGVTHTVTLEPTGSRWLLALDAPTAAPPGALLGADRVLTLARPVRERLRYTVTSEPDPDEPPLEDAVRRRCLEVPAASPRVRALAETFAERGAGGAVDAALRYFREGRFTYTLEPPLQQGDVVDAFLFETRRGFCEHFSGAFAVLLRLAGVPTRVVTGYLGGEHNPLGDYWIVRQADAHAWCEVWLGTDGWVRVDPTAAVAPERVERGLDPGAAGRGVLVFAPNAPTLLRALWRAWDSSNNVWNRWVLGYSRERQLEFLGRLGLPSLGTAGLSLAAAGAAAATFGALAGALALGRRPRRDPEQVLYRRFCRRMERRGLARLPHEGAETFARRVAAERPDFAGAAWEVSRLYGSLRYGPPMAEADRRRALHCLAEAVRRAGSSQPR